MLTLKPEYTDAYDVDQNYSYYIVINSVCYFQIQLRRKVGASKEPVFPFSNNLPKSAFGDYLYYTIPNNNVGLRVDNGGIIRVREGEYDDIWGCIQGSYPVDK